METQVRNFGVLIFTVAIWLTMFPCSLRAQAASEGEGVKSHVVLRKLFPPVYPPLARQALVMGDVHLRVSVLQDGTIKSVTPIDGPPLLREAALDSARQSQFDCQACSDAGASQILTYTFPTSAADPDPCCCSPNAKPYKPPAAQVSQSDDQITVAVAAPLLCVCPDVCTQRWAEEHSKFRSPKCLYLWKCGHRNISIQ
jgi:hypothetical protein